MICRSSLIKKWPVSCLLHWSTSACRMLRNISCELRISRNSYNHICISLVISLTRLKPVSSFLTKADDDFISLNGWLRFLRSYSCRDSVLWWRDDGEFTEAILPLPPRAVFVECLLLNELLLEEDFPEDLFFLEEVLLSSSGNRKAISWSVTPAIPAPPQKFIVGKDFELKERTLLLIVLDCMFNATLEQESKQLLLSQLWCQG